MIEYKAGDKIYVCTPKVAPDGLLSRFRDLFQSNGLVEEASYGQIFVPEKREPPHLVFNVRLTRHDDSAVASLNSLMGAIIRKYLSSNQWAEIMFSEKPFDGLHMFYKKNLLDME